MCFLLLLTCKQHKTWKSFCILIITSTYTTSIHQTNQKKNTHTTPSIREKKHAQIQTHTHKHQTMYTLIRQSVQFVSWHTSQLIGMWKRHEILVNWGKQFFHIFSISHFNLIDLNRRKPTWLSVMISDVLFYSILFKNWMRNSITKSE